MIVLGIETSCDETAVAVVRDDRTVMANLVLSQLEEHSVFGGVVPEIAARAHLDHLDRLIAAALADAGIGFDDLDGVAATCGPGLIGGVMVGMMAGKAIAAAKNRPFLAVNHLEAHVLTPRLTGPVDFPYLVLLVSGGHTQILMAEGPGRYRQLGATMDDALGECFDKAAKLMGLPFPGGPHLEQAAALCADGAAACERFPLPRPLTGRAGCDFSFSGLKTAVRQYVDKMPAGPLQRADVAALAFSFQDTAAAIVTDRCENAIRLLKNDRAASGGNAAGADVTDGLDDIGGIDAMSGTDGAPALVVVGGVAANKTLRAALESLAARHGMKFHAPPLSLCSDNGAMIAWAGIEKLRRGAVDGLDVAARPRWPLDNGSAQAV